MEFLPPDLVVHDDVSVLEDELPWSIPGSVYESIWGKATGRGTTVAIVDTGYQPHRLLPEPIEYINRTNEPDTLYNSHGIHCASSAIGRFGYGAAPGAKYIAVKVLAGRNGSGSSDWIARGIRDAVDAGADIISLSLGGPSPYRPTQEALEYAFGRGCCVCAAAGNSGFNGRQNTIGYPAKYGNNVISVGATKGSYLNQTIASFSSGGKEQDFAAPGERIIGAVAGNKLGYMSGTSMACPNLAGHYALALEIVRLAGKPRPSNYAEWKNLFKDIAIDAGIDGFDETYGHGLVMASDIVGILEKAIAFWGI